MKLAQFSINLLLKSKRIEFFFFIVPNRLKKIADISSSILMSL